MLNNPETQSSTGEDDSHQSSRVQQLQEEIDYEAIKYAREVLGLEDSEFLQGRMNDQLIQTINGVKLKHRTSTYTHPIPNCLQVSSLKSGTRVTTTGSSMSFAIKF